MLFIKGGTKRKKKAWREICICLQEGFEGVGDVKKAFFVLQ